MNARPFLLALSVTLVAVLGITATVWAQTGAILFSSSYPNSDIYLLEVATGKLTQLTSDPGEDITPSASPDGRKVAFCSNRSNTTGAHDLWIMNIDGTGEKFLATIPGLACRTPTWHPNGETIVFTAVSGSSQGGIYVIQADGSLPPVQIRGPGKYAISPQLDPAGMTLVWDERTSSASYSGQIFKGDFSLLPSPTLTNVQRCTNPPIISEATSATCGGFSPDGTRVVVSIGHGVGLMDPSFVQFTPLFTGSYPNLRYEAPTWSPDGQWLAFGHYTAGARFNIWICKPDGTQQRQLTYYTGSDAQLPSWTVSPVLTVEIDIKPGSYPNAINLGSNGVIPLAILSSPSFDAACVDPATVSLSGSGVAVRGKASRLMASMADVNNDQLLDLVLHVETENLDPGKFQGGMAVLTGETFDHRKIRGADEITIVP